MVATNPKGRKHWSIESADDPVSKSSGSNVAERAVCQRLEKLPENHKQ